jgi:phosphoadenosine phosphosulfate reductase
VTTQGKTYSAGELAEQARRLEQKEPNETLRWAVDEFFPDLALACSFGGPSGMVLVDMISRIEPRVEIFYLDTDFLFPETYETRDRVIARYGVQPVAYKSELTPEEQARQYGDALWESDPDRCCFLRKIEPNGRALKGKRAWVSGIRRDQATGRRDTPIVQWDEKFGLVKVNPLARWSEADVWAYIMENEVPYNPLHDRSFPSIGCTNCTLAVKPGDDMRAGRWSASEKEECGLHAPGEPVQLARGEESIG